MNSKNENYWLLEAPVSKAIWHMAIPMMLGMSVNMIYNLTDTFFIGKLNDTHALAAISLLLPFATFLMAIGNLAAVIYYIICIQREGKQLSVSFMDFKIELAMLKENFSVGFSAMILDGLLIISSLMFNYYVLAGLVLIPAIVIGNQLFQLNGVIFSLLVSEAISYMTGCVMYYLIRSK